MIIFIKYMIHWSFVDILINLRGRDSYMDSAKYDTINEMDWWRSVDLVVDKIPLHTDPLLLIFSLRGWRKWQEHLTFTAISFQAFITVWDTLKPKVVIQLRKKPVKSFP